MTKKMFAIFFAFFLFNIHVSAASLCSYKEQSDLNKKAANIKVSYEIKTEVIQFPDLPVENDYFEITLLNITEDFYVVVKNNINEEEQIFSSDEAVEGVVKFRWDHIESVTNFTIQAYSTDKTNCPDEKYKTFYLTTPRYNDFYNRYVCLEIPEFYMCQKYVSFSEVSEEKFLTQLDSYRKDEIDDSGKVIEEPMTLTDKIFAFLDNYKWYIVGSLVLVGGTTVIVYRIKTKKQRDLGL